MLNIKQCDLKFEKLYLVQPEEKKFIVIHHPADISLEPEELHRQHLEKGWAGAGYNVYIRKNGDTMILRPILTSGAHCPGHNRDGIGVCFEGNFEIETMTVVQLEAGVKALQSLVKEFKIPLQNIGPHSKYRPTDCPGKYFPLKTMMEKLQMKPETPKVETPKPNITEVPNWQTEAFEKVVKKGYIKSPDNWRTRLNDKITIGEVFGLLNAVTEPPK